MSSPAAKPASEALPHLGAIRAVTYCVPDLEAIEQAYAGLLGYTVVARAAVDAAQAHSWAAHAMEGARQLLLAPASGEAVYLRFIEDAAATGWRALMTHGWNVTEIVVQDVDALAHRLAVGPFEIIGPPRSLTRFPMIRAMQTLGPAGECCYFTQVGAGSGLVLAAARAFVGRVFIAVAAGPDVDALFEPYRRFGNPLDPPVATPVTVISRAHGQPADTLHRHGLVRLSEGTMIELDEYPSSATVRLCAAGRLPPGMAMVSFSCPGLAGHPLVGPPAGCNLPGVAGVTGCVRGAAGELIELVAPSGDHA